MSAVVGGGGSWLRLSYAYALVPAAVLGYFLLRIPIQVSDSFTTILALEHPFGELMRDQFRQAGYLRPGMWAELKLVYDLSGGNFFYWFRLTHVVEALIVIVLFVRLVQPRTEAAAFVVPLSLAILIGHHGFAWTVREAFPINTFLTMLVCCAVAANVAFGRHRWWSDVLAAALFAISALTVETGLLVWVIFVGGYLLGLRGVSRTGVIALSVLLAGYFVLRFVILDTGVPGLVERDSGFGFARYGSAELVAKFGDNHLPFYIYNVVASVLSVLIAEPRNGVFVTTRELVEGVPELPLLIGVVSSTLTTLFVCRFAWKRRRAWRVAALNRDDRLVLLFVMVLGANAAISYAYTKDVILSPAGWFFAAAAFVAVRAFIEERAPGRPSLMGMTWLAIASLSWAVRATGLHAGLDWSATKEREVWAYIDDRRDPRTQSAHTNAVKRQLQEDAVSRHPWRPRLRDEWTRLFEVE